MTETSPDAAHKSVAAVITYILLGQLSLIMVGVFMIIFFNAKVEAVMLGVLGGLITSVTGQAGVAVGFWVGSSSSSKAANAALAQIAGAGPPPPAQPLGETQTETKP